MEKKTIIIISSVAVIGTVATILGIRAYNKSAVSKMEKQIPPAVATEYATATAGASPSKKKKILKNLLALGKDADPKKVKAVLGKIGSFLKKKK